MDGMEFLTGENKLDTGITIKGAEDFVRAAKLIQDAVRRWDEIVTAHIEAMDSALTRFDLMVTRMETIHETSVSSGNRERKNGADLPVVERNDGDSGTGGVRDPEVAGVPVVEVLPGHGVPENQHQP